MYVQYGTLHAPARCGSRSGEGDSLGLAFGLRCCAAVGRGSRAVGRVYGGEARHWQRTEKDRDVRERRSPAGPPAGRDGLRGLTGGPGAPEPAVHRAEKGVGSRERSPRGVAADTGDTPQSRTANDGYTHSSTSLLHTTVHPDTTRARAQRSTRTRGHRSCYARVNQDKTRTTRHLNLSQRAPPASHNRGLSGPNHVQPLELYCP